MHHHQPPSQRSLHLPTLILAIDSLPGLPFPPAPQKGKLVLVIYLSTGTEARNFVYGGQVSGSATELHSKPSLSQDEGQAQPGRLSDAGQSGLHSDLTGVTVRYSSSL